MKKQSGKVASAKHGQAYKRKTAKPAMSKRSTPVGSKVSRGGKKKY